MKTVILAGGMGTRLAEETTSRPKPMVEIGGTPILVHIMNIYSYYGFNKFVVACGYLSQVIKNYFLNFHYMQGDLEIFLKDGSCRVVSPARLDWEVALVETGPHTMTGGRLLRLKEWLGDETFMCTYGDGVANVDIRALVDFHKSHGKLATVTSVHPPARFGNLVTEGEVVLSFSEKDQSAEAYINGGFFVFEPQVLDYINGDDTLLERDPLSELARDRQLMAFRHGGFWHPMDTIRDRNYLEDIWNAGTAPWKVW